MKLKNWSLVLGVAVIGTAIACGTANPPTAPLSTSVASGDAGTSGETLKIAAPIPTSPIGGAQLQTATVVLNFSGVAGAFATFTPSYELELKNAAGTMVANPTITATSYPVTATLALDSIYSWRVRATYQGKVGPWSTTVTFKTQLSGFITTDTIFDPMTTGRTVGTRHGSTTFSSDGLRLDDRTSYVHYQFSQPLQSGEFSFLEKGADEGNAGSKLKVMAMQEGLEEVTDNDYRMTVEVRGRDAGDQAGAIACRIITGDSSQTSSIFDCARQNRSWTSSQWYFFKVKWSTGSFDLEVRNNNEAGSVVYSSHLNTGTHAYRPTPHTIYLGVPVGRAGDLDATQPGMIVKNVWVGPQSTPRPTFPGFGGPGGN